MAYVNHIQSRQRISRRSQIPLLIEARGAKVSSSTGCMTPINEYIPEFFLWVGEACRIARFVASVRSVPRRVREAIGNCETCVLRFYVENGKRTERRQNRGLGGPQARSVGSAFNRPEWKKTQERHGEEEQAHQSRVNNQDPPAIVGEHKKGTSKGRTEKKTSTRSKTQAPRPPRR